MAHVRIMEPWEVGTPTQIPQRPGFGRQREGGVWTRSLPRYTSDDYLLARVQQDSNDRSALTASASLASDHARLFGPGEIGGKGMICVDAVSMKRTCDVFHRRKYHVWKGSYVAMLERRLNSKEENKREKRKGEEWRRSDQGGRCHHLITRQCPCYGQVYSTAARQGSLCTVFLRICISPHLDSTEE